MTVEFECKLRGARPLMPDSPEHFRLVLLIESVPRINEDKYPVLLLVVLFP